VIRARLGAPVRASILPPFGGELGQIAARAIGHITGSRRQHHRDGIIISELLENTKHFANGIPAQGVSLVGTVDRDFRNRTAFFQQHVFSFCRHEKDPFLGSMMMAEDRCRIQIKLVGTYCLARVTSTKTREPQMP